MDWWTFDRAMEGDADALEELRAYEREQDEER